MRRWLRETSMPNIINAITLVATVVVAAVCLVFVLSLSRGTGGGYWGFDAYETPRDAAGAALDAGDYRFLAFRLTGPSGATQSGWPNASKCTGHPLGDGLHLRMNHVEAQHGGESARLAHAFAAAFNANMHWALEMRYGATCEGEVAVQ